MAAVERGPLWATQFHPEKSGDAGARAAAELAGHAVSVREQGARPAPGRPARPTPPAAVAEARARTEREIAARRRRKARRTAALALAAAARPALVPPDPGAARDHLVVLLVIAVAAYVLLDSWPPRIGVVLLALLATPPSSR